MHGFFWQAILASICLSTAVFGQAPNKPKTASDQNLSIPNGVLSARQEQQISDSTDRALQYLTSRQRRNGSFDSIAIGQPGVTGFCVLAFLAQGKTPTDAQYGPAIIKAIDFICAQQKANGLIATVAPNAVPVPRVPNRQHDQYLPAVYNHAIAGLALAEAYGECGKEQATRVAKVIEEAIAATLEMQSWRKHAADQGGWRYLGRPHDDDSDLSITGWHIMFLRSARNAGFDVDTKNIDQAVAYVENCFQKRSGTFSYAARHPLSVTRSMAGAGVLAMAHAGKHRSKMAIEASNWILGRDFTKFNHEPKCQCDWQDDRYNYGVFLCTQAMYQQGGRYWSEFYPPVVKAVLEAQNKDGSWPPEPQDREFGNCYTTALCVLSLSVSDQLLPIFQR